MNAQPHGNQPMAMVTNKREEQKVPENHLEEKVEKLFQLEVRLLDRPEVEPLLKPGPSQPLVLGRDFHVAPQRSHRMDRAEFRTRDVGGDLDLVHLGALVCPPRVDDTPIQPGVHLAKVFHAATSLDDDLHDELEIAHIKDPTTDELFALFRAGPFGVSAIFWPKRSR